VSSGAVKSGLRTQDRLWAVGLFLNFTFLYLLTMGAGPRTVDEWNVYWVAESLARRGAVDIPQALAANMPYGRPGRDGRFYSPTELLPSVAAVPWVWVGQRLSRDEPSPILSIFTTGTLACASTAPVSAATVAVCLLLLIALGYPRGIAVWSAVVLGAATIVWPYAGFLYREPYLALALTGTFLLLLQGVQRDEPERILLAGLIVGLGFWCKREILFALPGFLLLAGFQGASKNQRWSLRAGIRLLLLPTLLVGAHLWFNLWRFGDPFQWGYPTIDETGKRLVAFTTPFWQGAWGLLLSPGKSLFLFSPPLLAAVVGLWWAWRRDRRVVGAMLLSIGVSFVLICHWNHWEGGWCWGPRHAVPWTPLLIVGFAALASRVGECSRGRTPARIALAGLVVLGVGVQCLGVFVNYFAYAADSGRYMLNLDQYQMSFSPWRGHLDKLGGAAWEALHGGRPDLDTWWCFFLSEGVTTGKVLVPVAILLVGLVGSVAWTGRLLWATTPPSRSSRS
jgi:hypothetical protein